MKLALPCFCVLQVAFVGAGLFRGEQPEIGRGGRAQLAHSRQRPLFARRRQYEKQRIIVQKTKEVSVPLNNLPPPTEVAPKPVKPSCSQLTQTCLPQSGCCDLSASCHCRFFNAICFCRRIQMSFHPKKNKK
uniref:Agouti domain-containing protein n=1 Tax=Mola mola TaxID=94237 RepID=A0A3Q3W5S5_MOLML